MANSKAGVLEDSGEWDVDTAVVHRRDGMTAL